MTKDLDILFVHANASAKIYQGLSAYHSAIEPPLWALMLCEAVTKKGFSAEILDCEAEKIDIELSAKIILAQRAKYICFVVYGQQPSASTQNMEGAVELCKLIKQIKPGLQTIFIGGHVSALTYMTMQLHPEIDFAMQNEGVHTLIDLLSLSKAEKYSQINGLGYREDGHIVLNRPSTLVQDLDQELGFTWNKINLKNYRTSLWHAYTNNCDQGMFASIYTSLGCSFKCNFCCINIINRTTNEYADGSNIMRRFSPEFVLKQLKYLSQAGIKNLKIADEMFVLNPNHFLKICDLIYEHQLKFNIWCYARIDTVKPEYLERMKRAGVNWLGLGIESGVKSVRQDVTKGKFEDIDIKKVVRQIRDNGIHVAANYIFGLPEDTYRSMNDTLDLAMELNTEMANFYSCMAYPGSPLYKQAIEQGFALPSSYSGYSQHSYDCYPLANKNLTSQKIIEFRDYAWQKYHSADQYLRLLIDNFGFSAARLTMEMSNIKLKRKLLGD